MSHLLDGKQVPVQHVLEAVAAIELEADLAVAKE
jgi:hypothetical protein